ncbi:MAG TPA: sulfotransferase domain-containing protein [Terriglobales bacterium]|nr:sulfotransferase domain-containing protein [Terriglobales bacterium]
MISAKRVWYQMAKSGLRAPLTRVRHWGLDRNDAFIASYPRSGNTWLRFVLFDILVSGQSSGFDEVNHIIPDVGLHQPAIPLLPGAGRLIKTHEPFQKEYRKAIYLVRDARDVVLSEFAYQKALGWIPDDFETFLQQFVRGEVNPFTAWHEHVPDWIDSKLAQTPNFLLIKFEEMRRNTEQTVVQVLDFLGVEVDRQVVVAAIANNTLKKMQEKEQKSPQLSSTAPSANGSEESRFIRSGSIAGWRNRLSLEQVGLLEDKAGPVLERMGYPIGEAARQRQAVAAAEPSAVNM